MVIVQMPPAARKPKVKVETDKECRKTSRQKERTSHLHCRVHVHIT